MRKGASAFWIGAALSGAVFVFTGATTVDLDATAAETHAIVITGRVDQGTLGRLFSPGSAALGRVRVTKHGWGVITTYTEQIIVLGAPLANEAGTPIGVEVHLEIPGTVIGTNATARDGRTLIWSALPADAMLWAQSRAVNWPVVTLLVLAIALTFWLREE
jgi:hypothetical protein